MTEMGSYRRALTNRGQRRPSVSQDSDGAEATLLMADPDFQQVTCEVQTGCSIQVWPELDNRRVWPSLLRLLFFKEEGLGFSLLEG